MCKLRYEAKTLEFTATSVVSLHLILLYNAGRGGRRCLCWFKHNTVIKKATWRWGDGGWGGVIREHTGDNLSPLLIVSNYPD